MNGARDEILLSAVPGLGERLVSGEVTPDEWIVRGNLAERRHVATDAIDAGTARSIAVLAKEIEALFGSPQDVEWALADDSLFVVQARPITALPEAREIGEAVAVAVDVPEGFWEREASHFPLPLSPMTRSLEFPAQNEALASAFAEHGLLADGLEFREIGGWMYTRVVPMGGKDRPVLPRALMWVLVRVHPALRSRTSTARRATRQDLAGRIIAAWYDETRPDLQQRIEALRDVTVEALDDDALLEHWSQVQSLLDDGLWGHFRLHAPIALARFDLARACRDLLGWDEPRAFELLSGLSATSTAPALALARLASMAAARPRTRELVERADRDAVAQLARVDPEFEAAFQHYQREYAMRVRRYDVADLTFAETPELTLATLRDQLRRGYDGKGQAAVLAARRSAVLAEARSRLAELDEADRQRFERVLMRAEAAHPVHEENEFFTVSVPLALARQALVEVGRRLASRSVIGHQEDVFFLERDEALGGLVRGGDLRTLVASRKGERVWVLAHPGPATYGQTPGRPPLEVLPADARRAMGAMLWVVELMFAAGRSSQRQSPDAAALSGIAASPGRYTGTVRVVAGEHEFEKIQAGDVLVCPVTSPVWSVFFSRIGALVTDSGGILSHPAIIAREYGVPAVVATGNATAVLHDGQRVTVDGDAGVVEVAEPCERRCALLYWHVSLGLHEAWMMLTGWFAIAAALLTVTGLVTLLAFFGTGSSAIGIVNDLNTIAMALVTIPVALALHALASRSSAMLATIALGADFLGVALAAGFSAMLVLRVMSFDATLIPITIGNGLIGVWLLMAAALLLASSAVPGALGWLGIMGGAGLATTAMAFPILGRDHPVIAVAGLAALIGLVGFYVWMGMLMIRDGLQAGG